MMKPALFVQDIQNAWLHESDSNKDLSRSMLARMDLVNEAIAWFRERGLPVIVGLTDNEEERVAQGTSSFETPDDLNVLDSDPRVTKRHANAFANPELARILREAGCDSIVIVGLSASGCVLATFFSAFDSEIRPYVLRGGIASHNAEHIRFAEEICDTVDLSELGGLLE